MKKFKEDIEKPQDFTLKQPQHLTLIELKAEMAEMQKDHDKVKEEVSFLTNEIELERYRQSLLEMEEEHDKLTKQIEQLH